MSDSRAGRTAVVLGGTQGIGKEIVRSLASKGTTVFLSGRTMDSARAAVNEIGMGTIPLVVDLSEPETIAGALASVTTVDDLIIPAIETPMLLRITISPEPFDWSR
jgi:short-subunit dehydrogenase